MNLLLAPLELKGTLTALEAAEAMAQGLSDASWEGAVDVAPLSDGGPGFTAILRTPRCLERVSRVQDPLGRPLDAMWLQDNDTALLEAASASGLLRLQPHERDPRVASSFGTGELIRSALALGCTRIVLGVGGSATNDGGTGAAAALGVRFLDADGRDLPPGGAALEELARIDLTHTDPRLVTTTLELATDVRNPLLGPTGATRTYSPQKGATPDDVEVLERGLARLAQVVREQLGGARETQERMGAAGGLAFGLSALCGAIVTDGFELAASELRLPQRIRDAHLVLTAEGQLDAQSAFGKGTFQVALRAEALGRPCVAFAGRVGSGAPSEHFSRVIEVSPALDPNAPDAPRLAREALRRSVRSWARGELRRSRG